jgi:hypothetical protein
VEDICVCTGGGCQSCLFRCVENVYYRIRTLYTLACVSISCTMTDNVIEFLVQWRYSTNVAPIRTLVTVIESVCIHQGWQVEVWVFLLVTGFPVERHWTPDWMGISRTFTTRSPRYRLSEWAWNGLAMSPDKPLSNETSLTCFVTKYTVWLLDWNLHILLNDQIDICFVYMHRKHIDREKSSAHMHTHYRFAVAPLAFWENWTLPLTVALDSRPALFQSVSTVWKIRPPSSLAPVHASPNSIALTLTLADVGTTITLRREKKRHSPYEYPHAERFDGLISRPPSLSPDPLLTLAWLGACRQFRFFPVLFLVSNTHGRILHFPLMYTYCINTYICILDVYI